MKSCSSGTPLPRRGRGAPPPTSPSLRQSFKSIILVVSGLKPCQAKLLFITGVNTWGCGDGLDGFFEKKWSCWGRISGDKWSCWGNKWGDKWSCWGKLSGRSPPNQGLPGVGPNDTADVRSSSGSSSTIGRRMVVLPAYCTPTTIMVVCCNTSGPHSCTISVCHGGGKIWRRRGGGGVGRWEEEGWGRDDWGGIGVKYSMNHGGAP